MLADWISESAPWIGPRIRLSCRISLGTRSFRLGIRVESEGLSLPERIRQQGPKRLRRLEMPVVMSVTPVLDRSPIGLPLESTSTLPLWTTELLIPSSTTTHTKVSQ